MRSRWAAAVFEVRRSSASRRWLAPAAVAVLVALLASGDVAAVAANDGLVPGALDVHAAAANNLMYVGYLFATSFVFAVGDTVIADRSSAFALLPASRGVSRFRWWSSKVAAVLLGAVTANAFLLAACVLVGVMWRGWTLSAAPSPLAAADSHARGLAPFPPVSVDAHMLLRQVLVALYLSLALWAVACAVIALTARASRPVLPVTVVLLGLMADYVVAKAWEPWLHVSAGARLLEGTHSPVLQAHAPPLWTSVVYFAALAAAAVFLGRVLLGRTDL